MIKNFKYVGSTLLGYKLVENKDFGRITRSNKIINRKNETIKTLRKEFNRRGLRGK